MRQMLKGIEKISIKFFYTQTLKKIKIYSHKMCQMDINRNLKGVKGKEGN